MTTTKQKPVYSITAKDDVTATAVYSCLKTLCQDWQLMDHYGVIWRRLRDEGSYRDAKAIVKKHILIRSKYKRKN
jgi:hypothetical protein